MKPKITLTMLSALIVLTMLAANANSQSHFSGPRNMGAVLNSADSDVTPVISPNGLSFYFTSNRPGGQGNSDIWVSHRATLGSSWGVPQNLGATVNTSSNDNIGSFSLDGRTMFFQSDRPGGMGGRDIYISDRPNANNDFGWTAPVNLGAVVNSTSAELQGAYFEDPATGAGSIIFSSDRVGTAGISFHFYQSTRNADGTFNAPTLINELNSVGAEFGAAIRSDGLEIFFGSARPGGLSPPPPAPPTFDIYLSTRTSVSAPWDPPVLVPGFNSAADDRIPKLSPDGSVLYFQSARVGGIGSFDLYSATRCSLYSATPCSVNRAADDFDGDGRTDISVFRPSEGNWYRINSADSTIAIANWGLNGDTPVAGDYDGDGRSDLAVFRPSDNTWYRIHSGDNTTHIQTWGLANDVPTQGDYDGDGKTDMAVFRPSDGTWYMFTSASGILVQPFGLNGDIPTLSAFGSQ